MYTTCEASIPFTISRRLLNDRKNVLIRVEYQNLKDVVITIEIEEG